jgi:hypothetical protein
MKWLKDRSFEMLMYGCIASIAALVILFGIRVYAPTLLDIDVKWLIVAAVPVVLALIAGRFITRFKWMGVDIEIAAEDPVIEHKEVIDILIPLKAQQKSDLIELDNMSDDQRNQPNVLTFIQGISNYYEPGAILAYVKMLPNIRFLMVTDEDSRFVALILISRKKFENYNFSDLDPFIRALEQRRIPYNFGKPITRRVDPHTQIVDVYEVLKKDPYKIRVLFKKEESLLPMGIITFERTEKYLANLLVKYLKKNRLDKGS